ncbi:MAG: hypothetical protein RL088_954, partial [Verrucomicrobiota bacterium]
MSHRRRKLRVRLSWWSRTKLLFGEFPVAVRIEFFQRITGSRNLRRIDYSVPICIKRLYHPTSAARRRA